MNFIKISPGDFIPFFSGLGLRPNSLLCPKSGGEKETHFHPAQFQCPENKKGITAVHAHPGSWSGYAFDLQNRRNWPPRQIKFLSFFFQRPYRPFPDITLRFYYFWILSKSVDRIFYGNLPRAREESSRSEREAANIGGIRCGRINPSRPICQPEKTGGERESPPAKEKGPREWSPRKGSGKVRADGNPGKTENRLSMMDPLTIRNVGRGKINPLPALAGRVEGL